MVCQTRAGGRTSGRYLVRACDGALCWRARRVPGSAAPPSPPAPVTDPLRDQLQTRLGASNTLERELGGGGMSRVFVAEEAVKAATETCYLQWTRV